MHYKLYINISIFFIALTLTHKISAKPTPHPQNPKKTSNNASVTVEIDPYERDGNIWKNFIFKVENQSSIPISSVQLTALGGIFDVMRGNKFYDISPNLALNNDGINSAVVIATFKDGGLAPGSLVRVLGSDIDQVATLTGFEAIVNLADGTTLEGVFENVGESVADDGDPDLWRVALNIESQDSTPDTTSNPNVLIRARNVGPVCCAEFKVQLMENASFSPDVANQVLEESELTTTTEDWQEFSYTFEEDLSFDRFRVNFLNDQANQDLEVDYIVINDFQFESEAPATYAVGVWNGVDCEGGFRQSQLLTCSGYFHYNTKVDTLDPEDPNECIQAGFRDAKQWPFAANSIWNMPIHQDAISSMVPANIADPQNVGIFIDENIVNMDSEGSSRTIRENGADEQNFCVDQGLLSDATVPVTDSFTTDNFLGITPNHVGSFLLPDKVSFTQITNTHICEIDGPVYGNSILENENILGAGLVGAYPVSGISGLGGLIRIGELDQDDDVIPHALKISLPSNNLFYSASDSTPGFKWPAQGATDVDFATFGGLNTALELGALLALSPDFDLSQLSTPPAKVIAQALKDYGAYVVGNSPSNSIGIATEWGPAGRVLDEFQSSWGFEMAPNSLTSPWATDMQTLFANLQIVNLNQPTNIAGGPTDDICNRAALLAPEIQPEVVTSIDDPLNPTQSNPSRAINIQLSPNPTQGIISIMLETKQLNSRQGAFRILNTVGEEIIHWENISFNRETSLDLSPYSPGIYFLQLRVDDNYQTSRILKN